MLSADQVPVKNPHFEDGTDLYWARSRVLEYLSSAARRLPAGVAPTLGPDATGVGWVYQYVVRGAQRSLAELRTIQDWYVRYGVAKAEISRRHSSGRASEFDAAFLGKSLQTGCRCARCTCILPRRRYARLPRMCAASKLARAHRSASHHRGGRRLRPLGHKAALCVACRAIG
jgi:hypothetical protein